MAHRAIRLAGEHARPLPRRVNLTEASVSSLSCPSGKMRVYVYDAKVPGLAVQVTTAGARSYYFYGRVRGQPHPIKHRLGAIDKVTLDTARRRVQRITADAADGIDPAATARADKAAVAGSLSLGELWVKYRDEHLKPKCRDTTLLTDENRFDNHLVVWANKRANAITKEDVAALHGRITKAAVAAGDSGNAADKAVKLLRRILNHGKVTPNPAVGAVKFHGDREVTRFLSSDEVGRLLIALEHAKYKKTADAIKLALYTGVRSSNVCMARWQDVHLDRAIWIIPEDQSKNRKPLTIHLPTYAVDLLCERRDELNVDPVYVFPGHIPGRPISTMTGAWRAARERAKIPDVRLHDLRHTIASWMAMNGASLLLIGKQLGHASKQSTARYAHLELDAVRGVTGPALAAFLEPSQAAALELAPSRSDARVADTQRIRERIGRSGMAKATVFRAAGMTRFQLNRILDGTYVPQQRSIDRLKTALDKLGL